MKCVFSCNWFQGEKQGAEMCIFSGYIPLSRSCTNGFLYEFLISVTVANFLCMFKTSQVFWRWDVEK